MTKHIDYETGLRQDQAKNIPGDLESPPSNRRDAINYALAQIRMRASAEILNGIDKISFFDFLRYEYRKVLVDALLEHEAKNKTEVDPQNVEEDLDETWGNRCPNCGADHCHSVDRDPKIPWLGLGVDEACKVCGADAIHKITRPLTESRPLWLIQELRDVQDAFENHIHSAPEGQKNREYFHQLIAAIRSAKHDDKKFWPSKELWEEYERKSKYAQQLIDKIGPPGHLRLRCDQGLPEEKMEELDKWVADLEFEYQAKQLLG